MTTFFTKSMSTQRNGMSSPRRLPVIPADKQPFSLFELTQQGLKFFRREFESDRLRQFD
ncbi:MAG TPA: hypothetical protein VK574_12385 [Terracidiphilus sp.]|nr:hypothetical protein [Terracidiphilus sp.]